MGGLTSERGFILVPSRIPDAVRRLSGYPPFRASAPYLDLSYEEQGQPIDVAAAFTRFLADPRLETGTLKDALNVLDDLAGWADVDVDNLIQLEFVEGLGPEEIGRLRSIMGPSLLALVADTERRYAGVDPRPREPS